MKKKVGIIPNSCIWPWHKTTLIHIWTPSQFLLWRTDCKVVDFDLGWIEPEGGAFQGLKMNS